MYFITFVQLKRIFINRFHYREAYRKISDQNEKIDEIFRTTKPLPNPFLSSTRQISWDYILSSIPSYLSEMINPKPDSSDETMDPIDKRFQQYYAQYYPELYRKGYRTTMIERNGILQPVMFIDPRFGNAKVEAIQDNAQARTNTNEGIKIEAIAPIHPIQPGEHISLRSNFEEPIQDIKIEPMMDAEKQIQDKIVRERFDGERKTEKQLLISQPMMPLMQMIPMAPPKQIMPIMDKEMLEKNKDMMMVMMPMMDPSGAMVMMPMLQKRDELMKEGMMMMNNKDSMMMMMNRKEDTMMMMKKKDEMMEKREDMMMTTMRPMMDEMKMDEKNAEMMMTSMRPMMEMNDKRADIPMRMDETPRNDLIPDIRDENKSQ